MGEDHWVAGNLGMDQNDRSSDPMGLIGFYGSKHDRLGDAGGSDFQLEAERWKSTGSG